MRYISTIRGVEKESPELYGLRAVHLATLFEKNILLPPTVIIKTTAAEEFMSNQHTNQHTAQHAKSQAFSNELQEELDDAYESISVSDDNTSAGTLMTKGEEPDVLLIPSFTKKVHPGDAYVVRALGKKHFFEELKKLWIKFHNEGVQAGIIVQKVVNEDISGVSFAGKGEDIFVHAYFGLQRFTEEKEYDAFHVSKSVLEIASKEIGIQKNKLVREDEGIEEYPLKERGTHQKANDKEVIEMARIAKRAVSYVNKDLVLYFGLKRKLFLFFVDEAPHDLDEAMSVAEASGIAQDPVHTQPEEELNEETQEHLVSTSEEEGGQVMQEGLLLAEARQGMQKEFLQGQATDEDTVEEVMALSRADPRELLAHSREEFGRMILNAESVVRMVLQDILIEKGTPAQMRTSIPTLIEQLHHHPFTEDLLKVHALKERFSHNQQSITSRDVSFAFEVAERLMNHETRKN
jgi:phosphoenolpyruvate synthase/pyruvate phosphate dikinase